MAERTIELLDTVVQASKGTQNEDRFFSRRRSTQLHESCAY